MYYAVLSLSEWSFIRNELEGQTMKMPSISVSFRVLFSILGIVGALLAFAAPYSIARRNHLRHSGRGYRYIECGFGGCHSDDHQSRPQLETERPNTRLQPG